MRKALSLLTASVLAAGSLALAAPAVQAAPSSSTSGGVIIKEGQQAKVTGKVPAKYAKSMVALDLTTGKKRMTVGTGYADGSGNVTVPVNMGGDGEFKAQFRVVKNGKTQWKSKAFDFTVKDSGKARVVGDPSRIFEHTNGSRTAQSQSSASSKTRMTKSGSPMPRSGFLQPRDATTLQAGLGVDVGADAAEGASKSSGQWLGDFAKTAGGNIGWDLVASGVGVLFGALFPGTAPATSQQVEELTQDVVQGFATVEAQLTTIEGDLNSLQSQVSTIQTEVQQANANAASASCNSLLAEANSYVVAVENAYGNYQTVMDSQWITANVVGQTSTQALKIVGQEVYGAGAGNPAFAQGVVSLQTDVSALANLLSQNGASSTSGIIPTCSTAISAGIVADNGSNTTGTVVPLGSIESAYYSQMHSIVAYYTTWMNLGQVLAGQGGYMAQASLAGANVSSSSDVQQLCASASPSSGASAITCPGMLFNTQNAVTVNANAWSAAGASWNDVSDGMLVSDARVDNTANYIQSPAYAWVKDISLYGEAVPGLQGPMVTTTVSAQLQDPLPACYLSGGAGGFWGDCPEVTTSVANNNVLAEAVVAEEMWSSTALSSFIINSSGAVVNFTQASSSSEDNIEFANSMVGLANGQYTVLWQSSSCYQTSTPQPTSSNCLQWQQSSTMQVTNSYTDTYYTPSGALSSSSASASTVPASGTTALASSNWLGVTFVPAKTSAWQKAFPFQYQTGSATLGSSLGAIMAQSNLLNGGQVPSNLLMYTGETSSFDVNANTGFGTAPQIPDNSEFKPGSTFSDSTLSAYSFLDLNTSPQAGFNPVIGAPSGSLGSTNNAQYVMSNQWATNGGGGQSCNVSGGLGSCTGNYSYTNYMSVFNSSGSFSPANGATNNSGFYSPLTQNNSYSMKLDIGEDSVSASYSNESASLAGTPSFMTSTPQQQYLWPVIPASSATAPCALTSFQTGTGGNAGVGNVCQQWFTEWLAGAVGVTTGPVSITAGGSQGVIQPNGSWSAEMLVSNSSGSAQTVSVYASISAGSMALSNALLVGDSTGASGNGASVSNCSAVSGDMLCTLTVQPGSTVLSLPIASMVQSSSTLQLALTGNNMASSSVTTLLPTLSAAQVVPTVVTNLNMVGYGPTSVNVSWNAPNAVPAVSSYQFILTDPSGDTTTYSSIGANAVQVGTYGPNDWNTLLPLPNSESGIWTVQVAAVNAAGAGPYASTSATVGNSVPISPENFTAVESGAGALLLDWDPVTSSPALSEYNLVITAPATAGQSSAPAPVTVSSSVSSWTVQNVTAVGVWSFSLTAANSLGSSPAVTTTVNVTGMVPTQPKNLKVTVDFNGWISAVFDSSQSVPTADTYYVSVFAPGASSPTYSTSVVVPNAAETVNVLNLFRLGSNSPVGTWEVYVSPSNTIGVGTSAQAAISVSQNYLSELAATIKFESTISEIPTFLTSYAANACKSGLWNKSLSVFGSCTDTVFVPSA